MPLRLIPAPSGSSLPLSEFEFKVAPAPSAAVSRITSSSRTPSMVTSNQPEFPETPVKRFPASLMSMFHARGMDNGEPGMGIFRCLECGSVVMEGLVKEHRDGCAALRMELEAMKKALSSTYGNKKGQRGGMKRTGSEITAVSPSPSAESPRKGPKRPRIEIAESVASNEDYTPGGSVDTGERMILPSGKLETKKAFEKRMVEARRLVKEQEKLEREQGKVAASQNPKGLSQKKEYDPDRHCGVMKPDNTPCLRKLDCKQHSVQAKRDVSGRSMSFDDLNKLQKGETLPPPPPETPVNEQGQRPPAIPDAAAAAALVASSSAGPSAVPPVKPKKGRKKHAEARRLAANGQEPQGPGALDHDALVQAIKTHTRYNAQIARNRMYGLLTAAPVEEVRPSRTAPPHKDDAESSQQPKSEQIDGNGVHHPGSQQPDPLPVMPDFGGQAGKGKAKPPGTTKGTMRFQTFAGGATSGYWHGDRRRMMAAENTMNEIFKQMRRHRTEAAAAAAENPAEPKAEMA